MDFQFQYFDFIWGLALLLILILLFIRVKMRKRIIIKKMGTPALVKSMIRQYQPANFNFKFFLFCIAFAMGVLAIMNLRKPSGKDGIQRKGIDVVFALDVSKSMLAKDISPNRLERAKQFMSKLINAMPDNRIGLVWFAGKAYVQMPISGDHSAAQMFVAEVTPDAVPVKGTVIGEALQQSLDIFGEREAKYKALILISDGEDHDEEALQISRELSQRGLMVNTIGIGSPQGSFIPDDSTSGNKIDYETGREIISKLNEQELKDIAANTHGVYVHLTNTDEAVTSVLGQLAQIDKKVSGDINLMDFSYYYWIFVALMLLFLIAEQLVPEGKRARS